MSSSLSSKSYTSILLLIRDGVSDLGSGMKLRYVIQYRAHAQIKARTLFATTSGSKSAQAPSCASVPALVLSDDRSSPLVRSDSRLVGVNRCFRSIQRVLSIDTMDAATIRHVIQLRT